MKKKDIVCRRKVILKGKYCCPIVPELGHYKNEGLYGYDKLVWAVNHYETHQMLFKDEETRDASFDNEKRFISKEAERILALYEKGNTETEE